MSNVGVVLAACVALGAPPSSQSPLDAIRAVEWNRRPAGEALAELAREAGRSVWIDPAVAEEMNGARITLSARHLRRVDAMRWAGRLAGAECLVMADRVAVCTPDGAPAEWRLAAELESRHRRSDAIWGRAADVNLVDVPLHALCRAIEKSYGVDVYVAAGMAGCQELVDVETNGLSLRQLTIVTGRQLKASWSLVDGMLIVDSTDGGRAAAAVTEAVAPVDVPQRKNEIRPESKAAAAQSARHVAKQPSAGVGRLVLHEKEISWREVAARAREAGVELELPEALANRTLRDIVTDGDAESVVEALLLSEGLEWRVGGNEGERRVVRVLTSRG